WWPSIVLLEGRPQPVTVHCLGVGLHLLPGAGGDHGAPLLVHLHHQLLGLLTWIAEVGLKDPGDVGHQVHRVIPDDGDPGQVRLGTVQHRDLTGPLRLPGSCGHSRRRHDLHSRLQHVSDLNPRSTALLTDHYELTMVQAALASGHADRRCVFEAFARRLPEGRRYGVVAGTGRFLEALAHFTFGAEEIDFLRRTGVVDEATLQWLAEYRFTGDIWGYAEGECYFP